MLSVDGIEVPVEDDYGPVEDDWLEDRAAREMREWVEATAWREAGGDPPPLVPGSAVARVLLAAWQGDNEWHQLDSLADLAAVVVHLSVRARAGGSVRVYDPGLLADLGDELRRDGLRSTRSNDEFWPTWGHGWTVYDPDDDPENEDYAALEGIDLEADPDLEVIPVVDDIEFSGCGAIVTAHQILFHGPSSGLGDPPLDVVLAAK